LFQPLLYQVATAALSPADIALPIRSVLRDQRNVTVRLGEVVGVDQATRDVLLSTERISFDYLVLATGAQHSYFGRDEWAEYAPGLKSIEDATAMRSRMLLAFEQAESEIDEAKREAWLTFVVVGGGPTGVELAGALAELARTGLDQEYRAIDPATTRVILVQSGPRVLPAFSSGSDLAGGGARFTRLRAVMSAEGNAVAGKIIAQTFDDTSHAFIDAICESLPQIPRTEIVWRSHFLLGALYYTLVTPERVSRLSRGEADGADAANAIEQLVRATVASLQAPALDERTSASRRSTMPLSRR